MGSAGLELACASVIIIIIVPLAIRLPMFFIIIISTCKAHPVSQLFVQGTCVPGCSMKSQVAVWNQKGKGEGGGSWGRGRVPGRTGRRSRCCGFAEVLGFSRAELSGTNIGIRELKRTARWCLTSPLNHICPNLLSKWEKNGIKCRKVSKTHTIPL